MCNTRQQGLTEANGELQCQIRGIRRKIDEKEVDYQHELESLANQLTEYKHQVKLHQESVDVLLTNFKNLK